MRLWCIDRWFRYWIEESLNSLLTENILHRSALSYPCHFEMERTTKSIFSWSDEDNLFETNWCTFKYTARRHEEILVEFISGQCLDPLRSSVRNEFDQLPMHWEALWTWSIDVLFDRDYSNSCCRGNNENLQPFRRAWRDRREREEPVEEGSPKFESRSTPWSMSLRCRKRERWYQRYTGHPHSACVESNLPSLYSRDCIQDSSSDYRYDWRSWSLGPMMNHMHRRSLRDPFRYKWHWVATCKTCTI